MRGKPNDSRHSIEYVADVEVR